MKTTTYILALLVTAVVGATLAFANPATLPKHPGYPIGNPVDPVNNQALANDPGQTNWFGDRATTAGASYHDKESQQNLAPNRNDERLLKKVPGQLPQVEGVDIKIKPLVKEGTRMK